MTATFFGEVDLASVTLWLFYIFFAGLVIWIQRENMREGYPLEDDEGNASLGRGRSAEFECPDRIRVARSFAKGRAPAGPERQILIQV